MTSTCDVLVIGSGAAGLAAAVVAAHHGLKVVVAEKTLEIGGTSAWSGGWLWIPRNPLAREAGIVESIDGPLAYLASEIGPRAEDPRIRAFLENGPEMVAHFRAHTAVDWVAGNTVPDFHATPGARGGGRSVTVAPYDARHLGAWADRLRPPLAPASLWGMGLAAGPDMTRFFNWYRSPANARHVARRLGRHGLDLLRCGRARQLVAGNALVARLLRSALDNGVEIRTGAPAAGLIAQGGRVVGARVGRGEVRAAKGVVLATGGFAHDRARIAALFDHAATGHEHHSAAAPSCTGDGLRLAAAVGGQVTGDEVHPAAWAPVSRVPEPAGVVNFPHLVDRAKPGFIAVGPDGRRFANEADSYHDFMSALFATGADHAWILADTRARRRFGIGAVKPFPFPDRPHLATGYLARAASLAALAGTIGVPAAALAASVARFNAGAARGDDPDFGRGASPYNRFQGDATHRPNPALGPLLHAPFYAVRVVPGSLGTFAGLRTDPCAQVLDAVGRPIPGLFAVGNDAASIFGGAYPAGGITLGPAMTFGYIAGRRLAGQPVTGVDTHKETAHVL